MSCNPYLSYIIQHSNKEVNDFREENYRNSNFAHCSIYVTFSAEQCAYLESYLRLLFSSSKICLPRLSA